ncbi:ATP-binding protein [candidate division KSB1 bacterium]|nr:ATP-binding protein [candidate division KSB1 bacterium]
MIERTITSRLINDLKPGKVTALFGARRTGKTITMHALKDLLDTRKILILNGEDFDVVSLLSSQRAQVFKSLVAGYDYLFIDEAHGIPKIGANLKLLVDTQPEIAVFVTGSASFDLRNQIGEPLTGRSAFYYLYPFSVSELSDSMMPALQQLPDWLIYGMYPQVALLDNLNEKRKMLENIRNGYLLKDVLELDNLKDSLFIQNLLKYIALQIGNDISYNELASNLKTTVKTVQRYLDILEKTFIIFRLQGFSKNLRKEISKSPRYFFWDNGIRNAIISNFNPPENRDDIGRLWENFCISERIKRQKYLETFSEFYFWRTYDKQEIDLIEIQNEEISAFEFKWGDKEKKAPKAFRENYTDATFQTINKMSFFNFLT